MKLELKDIAICLPYGLKIAINDVSMLSQYPRPKVGNYQRQGKQKRTNQVSFNNKRIDMNKKIYVAGAITGVKDAKSIFAKSCRYLEGQGYAPVSPFDNGLEGSSSWGDHMKADIKMLVDCEAIYMLNGWTTSRGASIEHQLAKNLGIEIIYEQ